MNDDARRILEMPSEGTIDVDEAEHLLAALQGTPGRPWRRPGHGGRARRLCPATCTSSAMAARKRASACASP